jgi:leucyl-tRNA synthetase
VRAYLMFGYRWPEGGPWNAGNIQGVVRWLNRVWSLALEGPEAKPGQADPAARRNLTRRIHQTIRAVSHDLEHFEFNTVISSLMELTNAIAAAGESGLAGTAEYRSAIETLVQLMAPATPHIAEELWERLGKPYSIHSQPWPEFDPALAQEDQITLVVQVNGKVRDRITVRAGLSKQEARERALGSEAVQRFLGGKAIKEVIVVPDRLVNIVVEG